MKKVKFRVTLAGKEGSSVAAIIAPFDVQEVFGTRARVAVKGTVNGFPFRSSLMPMQGTHMMVVNKELRDGAGVKAGDTVAVEMERDEETRTIDPPALLKRELTRNKQMKARWEKLSYTHKKEMARAITEAKQEETRTRRLAKVLDVLAGKPAWTR